MERLADSVARFALAPTQERRLFMLYDIRDLVYPKRRDVGLFDFTFVSRLRGAWHVFIGNALAVKFPIDELNERDVVIMSHELGLHKDGYAHTDCLDCFCEHYEDYKKTCLQVLDIIGESDKAPEFIAFLNSMAFPSRENDCSLNERWYAFHEHIAYTIGGFLGYGHPANPETFQEEKQEFIFEKMKEHDIHG